MFRRVFLLLMVLALGLACGGGGGGGSTVNPPTDFQAFASPSDFDTVTFSWTPPAGTITGYEGQMRIGTGSWGSLGITIPAEAIGGTLTFTTAVPENILLGFRLRSLDGPATSAWSNEVDLPRGIRPPSGLTVRYDFGNGGAALAWSRDSLVSDGVRLERSSDGGVTWTPLAGGTAATPAFLDATAQTYTNYAYRVTNLLGSTASAPCQPAALTYSAGVAYISATTLGWSPFGLTATWAAQPTTDLTGITGFRVERQAPDGTLAGWDLDGPSLASYLDTSVAPNVVYLYRVAGRFGTGYSLPSLFGAGTLAGIAPPLGVQTLPDSSPYGIEVTWWNGTDVGLADGVLVESAQSSPSGALLGAWTTVPTAAGLPTATVDAACQEEADYVYRVSYLRGSFVGLPSAPSSPIQAPLLPPLNLQAVAEAGGFRLTWQNQSARATTLNLRRSPEGLYAETLAGRPGAPPGLNLPGTATQYDDLADMGYYTYAMMPTDGTAMTESVVVNATTPEPADALALTRTAPPVALSGTGAVLRPSGSWIIGDATSGTIYSNGDAWPPNHPADFAWAPIPFHAADASGWPHFLYTRGTGSATQIVHAWFDGSAWNGVTIDQGTAPLVTGQGLARPGLAFQLDASGLPHALVERATVASPSGGTLEALTYLPPSGGAWVEESIPDLGMGLGALTDARLRLDAQGDAHLLASTAAVVAAWHRDAGGTWTAETIPAGGLLPDWGRFLDSVWADAANGWVIFERADVAPSTDYLLMATQKLAGVWQAPVLLGRHPAPQNAYNLPRAMLAAAPDLSRVAVSYTSLTGVRLYHHDAQGWHRTLVEPYPAIWGNFALGLDGGQKVHFYDNGGGSGSLDFHE